MKEQLSMESQHRKGVQFQWIYLHQGHIPTYGNCTSTLAPAQSPWPLPAYPQPSCNFWRRSDKEVQKEDTKGSPIQQPSSCICLQKNQLQNSLRIPGSIWEGYVFGALWQVVWTSKTMDNSGLEYSFPTGTSVCLGCVLFLSVVIFPTGFASKVKLIPLRPMSASRGMYRAKWSWRECQVSMTLQIKHGKGKKQLNIYIYICIYICIYVYIYIHCILYIYI